MFGTIRKFFSGNESALPPTVDSPKKTSLKSSTDEKVAQAIPPALSQKPSTPAKAIPKVRELTEEEKGSGVVFNVAKQFRSKFYNFCKGEDPRDKHAKTAKDALGIVSNAMDHIDGVSLNLKSDDGVCLEGKHFSLANLMSKMRDIGGQKVNFRCTENKHGSTSNQDFSGFVFDKGDQTKDLMTALTTMGFFNQTYKNSKDEVVTVSGPWEHKEIDGKIYVWKKVPGLQINKQALTSNKIQILSHEAIEPQQSRSTIVLNGGIHSYYESHRTASEVARLMALGFDVVVSQDKHPELLGSEAHEHVMATRDAIHDYLESKGIANEQIIWKGTCFSAIPAVEAAAKYAGSHVVIDQGYVDSVDQTSDYILPDLLKPVLKPMLQGCIESALDAFHFNYNMIPHLPNVQGQVCIIENQNDKVVSASNVYRMKELLGNKKADLLTITNPNVKHAGGWYEDAECAAKFSNLLITNGFSAGSII